MVKCPSCGAELHDGQKFCGECGTPIPQKLRCPQCGAEWPLNQKFCGECGHKFGTSAPSAPNPSAKDDKVGESPLSDEDKSDLETAIEMFTEADFQGAFEKIKSVFQSNSNNLEVYKWYLRILERVDKDAAYDAATDSDIAKKYSRGLFYKDRTCLGRR